MANIKSQIKRNRQNEVRRLRNKSANSGMKTAIKRTLAAVEAGEPTDELYRTAQREIDIAVSKGILKANTAARRKSRLAARIST
ncbi:30S ribosomal protein S20 [soil metagenome]